MIKNLSDRQLRSLKLREGKGYEVIDRTFPGLCLRILSSGVKTWSFRYNINGRAKRIALGRFPLIGLADAREIAREHLRAVKREGRDPSREKRENHQAEDDTFDALVDRYIEQWAKLRKKSWKGDRRTIDREIPKSWKYRPVTEITRRDIRELIEAKAIEAPISANRLRALLHKVFNFALEREIVDFNPVAGTPRPGVERPRQRVLTEDEIREFWKATESSDKKESMSPAMSAFWRLRLVTAQRAVEVNDMRWSDLDLDSGWWTIPAERSKNRLAHRVPLSDTALEIISGLPRLDDYVTAGARGNRQRSIAKKLISIDDFRGHDLRRTAASLMASAGIQRLHIGKVLNHVERGVTAVYDRHSYDPEKRIALDTWARTLKSIIDRDKGAKVVPITRS